MKQLYAHKHYLTDKESFRIADNGTRWGETPNLIIDAGSEETATLIAAAFRTLATIAKTPLWGEPVNDVVRDELRECGTYDDEEGYQPSADDESTFLRDCVEAARHVLGLPLSVDMPESEADNAV